MQERLKHLCAVTGCNAPDWHATVHGCVNRCEVVGNNCLATPPPALPPGRCVPCTSGTGHSQPSTQPLPNTTAVPWPTLREAHHLQLHFTAASNDHDRTWLESQTNSSSFSIRAYIVQRCQGDACVAQRCRLFCEQQQTNTCCWATAATADTEAVKPVFGYQT